MTCSSCKHWNKIRDDDYTDKDNNIWTGPHGICYRIDEFGSKTEKAWLHPSLGPIDPNLPMNADSEPSLITKNDFYCCLFEEKV